MSKVITQQAFELALQHHHAGRLNEAESIYRQILRVDPSHADSMHNLGLIAHHLGKNDVAVKLIQQVIALEPMNSAAYSNLGEAYRVSGLTVEAMAAQRQALELNPTFPTAYYNLGVALHESGQYEEAVAAYRQAIALKPHDTKPYNNLGTALGEVGRPYEAVTAYREALALHPGDAVILNNLGNALKDQGLLDESIAAYRESIDVMPEFSDAHSNLVFVMHYHPSLKPAAISEEHRRWNQMHTDSLLQLLPHHACDKNPQRCLRIGYVSPDFKDHSVAYFLEGLWEKLDRRLVTVYCYSSTIKPDAVTARLRKLTDHWRETEGLSDQQMSDIIREDGIDLLIDLAGHTAGNRLTVFARKPAPIQVTWLGYPNTTGLDTIDYRITDAFADPPGSTEHLHSETLFRMPHSAWCYRPSENAPPVSASPVHQTDHITFGSFNALPKINSPLLELWAKILLAVPGSKLRLKNAALGEHSVEQELRKQFQVLGIDPQRVETLGRVSDTSGHLAAYGMVDIALDTFPYHGTTTTCEALWMGVPVVTLAGKTHVSRVGVSLLTHLGHPEWIAASPEEYVKIATDLANDRAHLSHLRATLRNRMQSSPLMDATSFARDMEDAYRNMWRTWCEK